MFVRTNKDLVGRIRIWSEELGFFQTNKLFVWTNYLFKRTNKICSLNKLIIIKEITRSKRSKMKSWAVVANWLYRRLTISHDKLSH